MTRNKSIGHFFCFLDNIIWFPFRNEIWGNAGGIWGVCPSCGMWNLQITSVASRKMIGRIWRCSLARARASALARTFWAVQLSNLCFFIFCSTNWEDLIVKHRKWTCLDYLRFTFSFDQNDLSIVRKHNVVFLNMHKYCNASNSYDRLETVRLSSVLSFGALMISEPVNEVDTEIFKVGN